MKLRLYGLEHPESPLEHCWLKVAIEVCLNGHLYRFTDFEFDRRALQSSRDALFRLPGFCGLSTEILADYSIQQRVRCEVSCRSVLLKMTLGSDCKTEARFETTFPEIYRFRKQIERFHSLFPFSETQPTLDFVQAFRDYEIQNLRHSDAYKWVLQTLNGDVNWIAKGLMKHVEHHLRRRSRKKQARSEIEIYRLKKFSQKLAISKVFMGDAKLIAHFQKSSK